MDSTTAKSPAFVLSPCHLVDRLAPTFIRHLDDRSLLFTPHTTRPEGMRQGYATLPFNPELWVLRRQGRNGFFIPHNHRSWRTCLCKQHSVRLVYILFKVLYQTTVLTCAMTTLPNELWYEVLSYLSEDEADGVMGVSRVFYHRVWKRRYEEVFLLKATPYTLKRVQILRDPNVAAHVRSLWIQLSEIESFESALRNNAQEAPHLHTTTSALNPTEKHTCATETRRESWLAQLFACFFVRSTSFNVPAALRATQQPRPTPTMTSMRQVGYPILHGLVQGLRNVHTLAIHWQGSGVVRHVPPLLEQMWLTMNLRHLSLQVAAGGLHVALAAVPTNMSLESLSLFILGLPSGDPFKIIDSGVRSSAVNTQSMVALAKFVNASKYTLISLKIRCQKSTSLDALFSRMPPMPVLATLQLRIPYGPPIKSMLVNADRPLFSFLRTHNDSLRHLSLSFSGLAQSIIECLELTNLRTLDLTPFSPQDRMLRIPQLSRRVSLNALTLTRLAVFGIRFLLQDLNRLFEGEGWARLTSLSISIVVFDLALIRLLIEKTPALLELSLTYENPNFPEDGGLAHASFPAWGLYDVTLKDREENVSYKRMKDMAIAIPSIHSFCGSNIVYETSMKHFGVHQAGVAL